MGLAFCVAYDAIGEHFLCANVQSGRKAALRHMNENSLCSSRREGFLFDASLPAQAFLFARS
jgi:hypothetical protein